MHTLTANDFLLSHSCGGLIWDTCVITICHRKDQQMINESVYALTCTAGVIIVSR